MEWKRLSRVSAWQAFDGEDNCATVLHLLDSDVYLWVVDDREDNSIAEGSARTLDEARDAAETVLDSL